MDECVRGCHVIGNRDPIVTGIDHGALLPTGSTRHLSHKPFTIYPSLCAANSCNSSNVSSDGSLIPAFRNRASSTAFVSSRFHGSP